MRYRVRAARGDEDEFVCKDDVWIYLLSPREQLALLCHMAVRTGLCGRDDLRLERFSDQAVAVAAELLLTESEHAIALEAHRQQGEDRPADDTCRHRLGRPCPPLLAA